MKPSSVLRIGLFVAFSLLAGCDSALSGPNGTGIDGGNTGSVIGVWISGPYVLTLKADSTATESYAAGQGGSAILDYRFSGTWSVSGDTVSIVLPATDSSLDGTNWYPVPGAPDPGGTFPFSVQANTLTLGTGNGATTYSRSTAGGSGTTPASSVWAPDFDVPAGTYTSSLLVSITSATLGAQIYYTTDGTAPTTASWRYIGPVQVGTTTTLSAVAVSQGATSAVSSAQYTIQDGGPVTTGALVGTWQRIVSDSYPDYSYQDTVTLVLSSGGSANWSDRSSETDPTTGEITNSSQNSSGTWRSTATQLTTILDGATSTSGYDLVGNTLTIDAGQSVLVYQRE
ncbi:MAG TPA: chitobiase/beta-hexosaminidase C-terminal domain-containing protein [Fibrobacteria bacterium]|nr:chitobiase/beta-hexosaminidase C-terminal domain-containing protein [Fibrobacteria bacterium]